MTIENIFNTHSERYDHWFEDHPAVYESELAAVRAALPDSSGHGMEIGIGTGRFAVPLGIKVGVEPADAMRQAAIARGLDVLEGTGEVLPFKNGIFDFALMVTTICFLDDPPRAFDEAFRVLKPGGLMIVGFVDRESPIGKAYESRKGESLFYREAHFFTVNDVVSIMKNAGFDNFSFYQTLFHPLNEVEETEPVKKGHGEGSFVVITAQRKPI